MAFCFSSGRAQPPEPVRLTGAGDCLPLQLGHSRWEGAVGRAESSRLTSVSARWPPLLVGAGAGWSRWVVSSRPSFASDREARSRPFLAKSRAEVASPVEVEAAGRAAILGCLPLWVVSSRPSLASVQGLLLVLDSSLRRGALPALIVAPPAPHTLPPQPTRGLLPCVVEKATPLPQGESVLLPPSAARQSLWTPYSGGLATPQRG